MIELLSAANVPSTANVLVCRHSARRAVLMAVAVAVVAGGLLSYGLSRGAPLASYIGCLALAALLIFRRFVLARLRPSNWLVRVDDRGLFIQFRSYLNHRLPASDRTVMLLPFESIRFARTVTRRMETTLRDADDPWMTHTSVETTTWLELEVRVSTDELARALDAELTKRPVTAALYRDYPVRLSASGAIQVLWGVTPPIHEFLQAIASRVAVREQEVVEADYVGPRHLPAIEQRQSIKGLVRSGHLVDAVGAARVANGERRNCCQNSCRAAD